MRTLPLPAHHGTSSCVRRDIERVDEIRVSENAEPNLTIKK